MKRWILTTFLIAIAAVSVRSQGVSCPTGFQCVPQETFNKMVGHLESLVEAKDAIAKLLAERGASEATINSALQVIEGWKSLDAINNTIIAKQKDVIALYERTLKIYADLVEKLEARLMKPKSAWSKFLDTIKTVLTLAAGIALGRGL